MKELRRALQLEATIPGAHYLLGQVAVFRGDIDRGVEELRQELSINPNSATAHYKLGDAFTRREEWDQAIPLLQRAVWWTPIPPARDIPIREGVSQEEGLRHALVADYAHYLLGQTLIQSGKVEEGRKMLDRSRQLRADEIR